MNHITKDTIFCLSNCFIFVFVCLFVCMDLIPFSFIYFKICFWCLLDRSVQESKERTTCRRFQTQTQIPAEVFYGWIAPQPGELYCIEVQFKRIPCCVCQHAVSVKWLNKKTNKQIWEKGANVQRNTQMSEGRLCAVRLSLAQLWPMSGCFSWMCRHFFLYLEWHKELI